MAMRMSQCRAGRRWSYRPKARYAFRNTVLVTSIAASRSPSMRSATPKTSFWCSRTSSGKVTCRAGAAVTGRASDATLAMAILPIDTPRPAASFQGRQPRPRRQWRAHELAPPASPALDGEIARRDAERVRERPDDRLVRRALGRRRGHAHDDRPVADAADRGATGARDGVDLEADAVAGEGRPDRQGYGSARSSASASGCATNWIASSATNGERSRPPIGGSARRIGRRKVSLTPKTNSPRPSGSRTCTHDSRTRTRITKLSAWKSTMTNALANTRRNAPTSSGPTYRSSR